MVSHFFYVNKPFTDLLAEPKDPDKNNVFYRNRESQLLYNEEVRVLKAQKDWYLVEALEQLSFRQNGLWAPYHGWVKKEDLRDSKKKLTLNAVVRSPVCFVETENETIPLLFGTYLRAKNLSRGIIVYLEGKGEGKVKEGIVKLFSDPDISWMKPSLITGTARLFEGCPYLWGGRSMKCTELESSGSLTGVDCSGFVNLVFRAFRINIPRDAHEQFMVSKKIKGKELRAGDLIFICPKSDHEIVDHVMIYLGKDTFIEGSSLEEKVKVGSLMEKFSIEISSVSDERVEKEDFYLMFGRILNQDELDKTD